MTFKRRSTVHPINIDVGSAVDNALVQKEVEKMALKGVDLTDINDEDEQFRAAGLIRSMAAPIPIKRAIRRKYISGPIRKVSGCASCQLGIKRRWRNLKVGLGELGYKLSLFNGSFKSIEGYQGSGVLSYFIFLKWLLRLNVVIFLLVFLFTTLPEVIFTQQSLSSSTANLSAAASLSKQCSANYTVATSPYVLDNVQDFLQGTGWMEKTVMFLGDYSSTELYIGSTAQSTFHYNLPLAVLTVAAVCLALSLILMAVETALHFRKSLANGENNTFVNKVFCAWDFAIENDEAATVTHGSIYMNIWADIDEAALAKQRLELSKCDKCRLYTIRGLINFIVIAMIGGSIYLIYFVSSYSTEFIKSPSYKNADSFVQLLVEFLPSLTITGVNSFCPVVFGILINFEKYSAGFQVQLMLLRIVFLKMISLAVLVAQLYFEVTCSTKNSCGVGDGTKCVEIQCWETYVGQQFYKLIILDFFVLFVVTFLVEFPRKLLVTKCNCCLSRVIGRQEYDVPKNVLDLVYSQMLIWIGFFFAPLIPSVIVPKLFFTFYMKKFSALVSCVPPQRPYKASKANTFFMIILMFAFFLSTVPIIGSVVSIDPSKSCGPFRLYDDIYDVYGVMITGWPDWMQSVMNVLSSAVFILPLLFILGLAIYYFKVVSRGNQDIIRQLKEQLAAEGRDRKYLIHQLGPTYGDKPTKPKTPPKVVEPRPSSDVTPQGLDPQDDSWA